MREGLGLEGKKVVGVIGLSGIDSAFIMDSIKLVSAKEPDAMFLFVGSASSAYEMKRKGKENTIFVPEVPYEKVADYFAALDVGLYCGGKTIFSKYACPIKVLEYSACRKPIVCTNLPEVRDFGFPNILFAEPNAKDFAEKIVMALNQKFSFPNMREFELPYLSKKLEKILQNTIKQFDYVSFPEP